MNLITSCYALLLLVSLSTFIYALWSYYECPSTRSHKPYVFPIFASVGWFVLAVNDLMVYGNGKGIPANISSFVLLTAITLLALLIFVHYYRRDRQHEAIREKNPV